MPLHPKIKEERTPTRPGSLHLGESKIFNHGFHGLTRIKTLASHYSAMLAAAGLLCFVAKPTLATQCGLCLTPLRWLGLISYEWYLFHQAPHVWLRFTLGSAEGNLLKYLTITMGPFLGSLVLAALVYRTFSLPILRKHRS